MKATTIPNTALTGTGGGGSYTVSVPTIAPGVGTAAGDPSLSTEINPGPASVTGGCVAPAAGVLLPTGV
jgi:hypothetical protein